MGMFNAINDASLWGNQYQGRGGMMNKGKFIYHNIGHSYDDPQLDDVRGIQEIRYGIQMALPAFQSEIEAYGLSPNEFKEQLFKTGIHESNEGVDNRQITSDGKADGKGRGWWMIEADTAMYLLQGGGSKLSDKYIGDDANAVLRQYGLNRKDLHQLGKNDPGLLGDIIQSRPAVGALFAGAKYISKIRNSDELKDKLR